MMTDIETIAANDHSCDDSSSSHVNRRGSKRSLDVYQAGRLTVVAFGRVETPDDACVAGYRQELTNLIRSNDCEVLAFDLTDVRSVSSGVLGLLVSLIEDVREIQLFNASREVRALLGATNQIAHFSLHEVDIDGLRPVENDAATQ